MRQKRPPNRCRLIPPRRPARPTACAFVGAWWQATVNRLCHELRIPRVHLGGTGAVLRRLQQTVFRVGDRVAVVTLEHLGGERWRLTTAQECPPLANIHRSRLGLRGPAELLALAPIEVVFLACEIGAVAPLVIHLVTGRPWREEPGLELFDPPPSTRGSFLGARTTAERKASRWI